MQTRHLKKRLHFDILNSFVKTCVYVYTLGSNNRHQGYPNKKNLLYAGIIVNGPSRNQQCHSVDDASSIHFQNSNYQSRVLRQNVSQPRSMPSSYTQLLQETTLWYRVQSCKNNCLAYVTFSERS